MVLIARWHCVAVIVFYRSDDVWISCTLDNEILLFNMQMFYTAEQITIMSLYGVTVWFFHVQYWMCVLRFYSDKEHLNGKQWKIVALTFIWKIKWFAILFEYIEIRFGVVFVVLLQMLLIWISDVASISLKTSTQFDNLLLLFQS